MPMIDIYATVGTFADAHKLAADAAAVVKGVENVPDIPMFRQNTAAFVHEMAAGAIANVDGDGGYVRVQVLTNAGALDREKQIAVVSQLTDLVAAAANDPGLKKRTWVLLTEATPGGWDSGDTPIRTMSCRRGKGGDRKASELISLPHGERHDLHAAFAPLKSPSHLQERLLRGKFAGAARRRSGCSRRCAPAPKPVMLALRAPEGKNPMKHFLIKYRFKDGSPEAWRDADRAVHRRRRGRP